MLAIPPPSPLENTFDRLLRRGCKSSVGREVERGKESVVKERKREEEEESL